MVLILGVMMVFIALGVVAVAVTGERAGELKGVGRSLAALEAISSAPPELKADLDKPFGERVLEPLQARALALGRRLSGADSAARLQRKLDYAGNPRDWGADRVISAKVIGAVAIAVVGLAAGFVLDSGLLLRAVLLVGGLILGFFLPDFYLYQKAYDRGERIQRELPDAIDLMTISVEAGMAFDGAVQQVARNTEGPLSEEFARMLREMQIGQGRAQALRGLGARSNVDDLKAFVGAMVQADSFGIPIANVLRIQSSEMRTKRRQRAEEKAQQVPVKITVPLIFCILPCLFVAVMGPAVIQILDNF